MIAIEEGQITKAIGPFLREEMVKQNTFLNILPLKPHRTDKIMRARSIQARMRAGAVKFDKASEWYPILEDECLKFPRARHDDQVDALAYLGLMIDRYIPGMTKEEVEQEEYEEELHTSGYYLQGKNETTGY
jgi:predicted phage terminase large subunit-like protein